MPEFDFDWGSAPRPATPTFDWGSAPRPAPATPITPIPAQTPIPKPTPIPEIDFSTAPRPQPTQPSIPYRAPTIYDMVPQGVKNYGSKLWDKASNAAGIGVDMAGVTLAAGQDMLGEFNKWRTTPKAPEFEQSLIDSISKTGGKLPVVGPYANKAAEFAVRGSTAPLTGGPGGKALGYLANKAKDVGEWAITPKYPETEEQMIEGMTDQLRPEGSFGRPMTHKAIEFGMEGSTAPIGIIPVAGAIGGRMLYKQAPKIARKLLPALFKAAPKVHGPLTMEQAFLEEVANAKSLAGEQLALYAKEKSRRVREMLKVDTMGRGLEGFTEQKAKLGGALPKVPYETIEQKFTKENIATLYDKIQTSKLSPLDKISAKQGLEKMMGDVVAGVPERSEMILLRKVWPELKSPLTKDGVITSLGNISRTFMSSSDFTSQPLRQGATLVSRKKFWESIPKGLGSAMDEGTYNTAMKEIKSSKHYDLGHDFGKVDITDLNDIQEENFASEWANSLPVVKHSARAFSATSNYQRQGLFDEIIDKGAKLGRNIDPKSDDFDAKFVREVGDYVNAATGRGNLGFFERYARPLNATIYSPRFAASRLGLMRRALIDPFKAPLNVVKSALGQTPYERIDPIVRKEAWRDAFAFAGMQAAILSAAKVARAAGNDVEVGDEPTSTDWGKIKSGNARLDFNAGFQPYARSFAQLAQLMTTSSVSGKQNKLEEGFRPETSRDILDKLITGKEAPLASFINNFLEGQDLAGMDVNLSREMRTKMTPIIMQDIMNLLEEDPSLLPLIVPANFGAGLQVYGPGDIKRQQSRGKYEVKIPKIQIPKVGK